MRSAWPCSVRNDVPYPKRGDDVLFQDIWNAICRRRFSNGQAAPHRDIGSLNSARPNKRRLVQIHIHHSHSAAMTVCCPNRQNGIEVLHSTPEGAGPSREECRHLPSSTPPHTPQRIGITKDKAPLAEQTSQSAAGDFIACKSTRAVLAHSATGLSVRSPKDPAGSMGHNHARTHTGDPNT